MGHRPPTLNPHTHSIALANAGITVRTMEACKPKPEKKPGNCPACGAWWDGEYCEYHMEPRRPVTLGVSGIEITEAFRKAFSGVR